MIRTKRIYDPPETGDGKRVLVDRLWPRGMTRNRAKIDEWLKDVAPSHELRKWFQTEIASWEEFVVRYRTELQSPVQKEYLERLLKRASDSDITLIYSVRDPVQNHAVVLKRVILEEMEAIDA